MNKSGKQTNMIKEHSKAIMNISWEQNRFYFLTASRDGYAKLFDGKTMELLKKYNNQRPLNACSISPIKDEVNRIILWL